MRKWILFILNCWPSYIMWTFGIFIYSILSPPRSWKLIFVIGGFMLLGVLLLGQPIGYLLEEMDNEK